MSSQVTRWRHLRIGVVVSVLVSVAAAAGVAACSDADDPLPATPTSVPADATVGSSASAAGASSTTLAGAGVPVDSGWCLKSNAVLWPGAEGHLRIEATTSATTVGDVIGMKEGLGVLGMEVAADAPVAWDAQRCVVTIGSDGLEVTLGKIDTGALVLDHASLGDIGGSWGASGDVIEFGRASEGCGADCVDDTSVRFGDIEASASGEATKSVTLIVPGRPLDTEGRLVRHVRRNGELVAMLATSLPAGNFTAG